MSHTNPKAVSILKAIIAAQCYGECEDCFEDGLPCFECRKCRQRLLRAIARKLGDRKLGDDFVTFMKSIGADDALVHSTLRLDHIKSKVGRA